MGDTEQAARIEALEREILERKAHLAELYRTRSAEPVDDYRFVTADGDRGTLLDLFDGREDLILVHNMGRDCAYCTMWADGFNGLYRHIEDRAAFVVCSPDPPAVQRRFAASRGWSFEMVSPDGGDFIADMGYYEAGRYRPGVSTFHRTDGEIVRIASRRFGPHDDFCAAWSFFDMLCDGVDGWTPRLSYDGGRRVDFSPHIAVDVADRDGALSLYRDHLGMEVVDADGADAVLTCGDIRFYLQEADRPQVYLEFEVDDLADIAGDLAEAGCQLEPTEIPDAEASFMVSDPFGLRFHLFERPESS